MFTVCIEYKDTIIYTYKYFHDVKYLKTTDKQMHLFCDHGMTILLDLAGIENINIYRKDNEEDNNERIN